MSHRRPGKTITPASRWLSNLISRGLLYPGSNQPGVAYPGFLAERQLRNHASFFLVLARDTDELPIDRHGRDWAKTQVGVVFASYGLIETL